MITDAPTAFERMLARSIAEQAAIDAAWRRMRRCGKPEISLSEIIARVHRRCPGVPSDEIKYEIERRMDRMRMQRIASERAATRRRRASEEL
jgi:hypothetical protein